LCAQAKQERNKAITYNTKKDWITWNMREPPVRIIVASYSIGRTQRKKGLGLNSESYVDGLNPAESMHATHQKINTLQRRFGKESVA
jgi:hypothetical protein